jgi:hypothetical protein
MWFFDLTWHCVDVMAECHACNALLLGPYLHKFVNAISFHFMGFFIRTMGFLNPIPQRIFSFWEMGLGKFPIPISHGNGKFGNFPFPIWNGKFSNRFSHSIWEWKWDPFPLEIEMHRFLKAAMNLNDCTVI